MAALVLAMLILAMTGHSTGAPRCATWCVCKDGVGDSALQKTLDYACGAGADCNPIHQTGTCFQPNTVRAHCSYAVNSYFQKKNQAQGSCDFAGTATVTATDPSATGCAFPASASAAGSTSTTVTPTPITTNPPSTTTPSTTTPSTTTPTTTTPYTGTPTGVLGGVGSGLGPSGVNTDYSDGGFSMQGSVNLFSSLATLLFSGLMLLWG